LKPEEEALLAVVADAFGIAPGDRTAPPAKV